jgi:hypothetical protein
MMCRWNTRLQVIVTNSSLTLLPPSPPPPPPLLGAPPTSHTLSLITVPFVAQHMAIQGCFITTSFDINYWHQFT